MLRLDIIMYAWVREDQLELHDANARSAIENWVRRAPYPALLAPAPAQRPCLALDLLTSHFAPAFAGQL